MKEIKPAILIFLIFTLICGGLYPAVVTGIAQGVFPKQADGSLIFDQNGKTIGSALIGQPISDPKYFWPRPSASAGFAYNPLASGGSNAGPTNADYLAMVGKRVKVLRDSGATGPIPAELVQASASGLDPHLSPAGAMLQVPRVAKARGMAETQLAAIVAAHTEDRQLGFLGDPRVNVLVLNVELDRLQP